MKIHFATTNGKMKSSQKDTVSLYEKSISHTYFSVKNTIWKFCEPRVEDERIKEKKNAFGMDFPSSETGP